MTPFAPKLAALALLVAALAPRPLEAADQPHNVILFVPDGLRAVMVDKDTAPTMAAVRDEGVNFKNSHALFPTFTTANASAFATGHYLGDTGDWSNTILAGFPVRNALDTIVPFIENDMVLGELDAHFGGNCLDEETLLAAARRAGLGTAAVGKLGPTLIQDHTDRAGEPTIIIDDYTGKNGSMDGPRRGIRLSQAVIDAMNAAGLVLSAPGTDIPNVDQQKWFADAFTKVVLPQLKARGKPFLAVFWSRDPDGTQHNQNDSQGAMTPGLNGPTSLKAIRNADQNLAEIRAALATLGLDATTDIIISADHGFSTISKQSDTSIAAKTEFADVPKGQLPNGFVALDLAHALGMPLFDPDQGKAKVEDGSRPRRGNGLIGPDRDKPEVIVAANGGSELIYLPRKNPLLARKVVDALLAEDYVSGIFVRDNLSKMPGTLPMSAIGLVGSAITPAPAISISFKSFATGCTEPLKCAAEIADTNLGQGQGMHGSFSRADTYNFQAAIGPDFKHGFVDEAPSSNADIAVTIGRILELKPKSRGKLVGRALTEALTGGTMPSVGRQTLKSAPAANGLVTVLNVETVGPTRYFDAGGFPGRTVGLIEQ